jgi:predicted amidohydrolase
MKMEISTPDPRFVLAAAQSASRPGDLRWNVANHLRFCRAAAGQGVDLLVFPELSLTGYELALAPRCVVDPEDAALDPLRDTGLTVAAGAPVRGADGQLHIGLLVFLRDGSCRVHTKVHVHSSEMPPYAPGPGGPPLPIAETSVGLAICADASHPQHAAQAARAGARVYAASVMIEEDAYARKTALLQGYAREHRMAVLMANYSGITGGCASAGKSAIWAEDGSLLAIAPPSDEVLVVGRRSRQGWTGEILAW